MNGIKNLDELLDELEVEVSRMDQLSSYELEQLLLKMDQIHDRIGALQEKRLPSNAEEAQFEYLVKSLKKDARTALHDLGGPERLAQLRDQYHPADERSWWYLDRTLHQQRRKTLRTILLNGGITLLVLLLLVVAYRTFLAPNPAVSASYAHQLNAEQYLAQNNFQGALNEVRQALAATPGDPGLLILKGAIESKLGQTAAAAVDFQTAQTKLGSESEFRLLQAQQWLAVGDPNLALADTQAVIQADPTSAQGYFYQGKAQEALQQYQAAMDSYQTASQLAELQGQTQLDATIRISLALLMQSMPAQLPTPVITPNP